MTAPEATPSSSTRLPSDGALASHRSPAVPSTSARFGSRNRVPKPKVYTRNLAGPPAPCRCSRRPTHGGAHTRRSTPHGAPPRSSEGADRVAGQPPGTSRRCDTKSCTSQAQSRGLARPTPTLARPSVCETRRPNMDIGCWTPCVFATPRRTSRPAARRASCCFPSGGADASPCPPGRKLDRGPRAAERRTAADGPPRPRRRRASSHSRLAERARSSHRGGRMPRFRPPWGRRSGP
mmetsp:Transcript_19357/g.58429  ORF Transcript_19357/g.58429 Transcript_19357/m.58429 type:complete len:236 (+) Transcript_19357:426-1133(+)